jgi:hypothetical protein
MDFLQKRKETVMSDVSQLQEQLGSERFSALVNPTNTEQVKKLCDDLLKDSLPTEMTVGDRTYEILGFLQGDEKSVVGHVMVDRAKEMNANLGKEDGEHILKYQDEIPVALRGKVVFIFPDWRHPDDPENAFFVYWSGDEWIQFWGWLGDGRWDRS